MGNANSAADDEEDDAWGRAMDPDNHKSWRERDQDAREFMAQVLAEKKIAANGRLIRLTYSSVLTPASHGVDMFEVISDIVASAVTRNTQLQVGGFLSFDPVGCVVTQELEGPERTVRELFAKIKADTRHHSICVAHESAVPLLMRKHTGFGMRIGTMLEGERALVGDRDDCLRLVYASRLLCSNGATALALLAQVVRAATNKNPRLQIGGELFLDVSSLQVVQVLEGPRAVVQTLYKTIQLDLRHEHCTLLSVDEIDASARQYSRWGMHQADITQLRQKLGQTTSDAAAQLLRRWQRGDRTSKEQGNIPPPKKGGSLQPPEQRVGRVVRVVVPPTVELGPDAAAEPATVDPPTPVDSPPASSPTPTGGPPPKEPVVRVVAAPPAVQSSAAKRAPPQTALTSIRARIYHWGSSPSGSQSASEALRCWCRS